MRARTNGRLVYDSDRAAARVGKRSAGGFGRTLLYRSDRLVVDLFVHPGTDELRLYHGQVVDERSGSPVAAASVRLAGEGDVPTDEFGQFALSSMSEGEQHLLRVTTTDQELLCAIPGAPSLG
jgi:hypothetical protein